jgi:hypothetical protein
MAIEIRNRTFRMYGLVPYNLSPIQKGIQYGHAVVEYASDHFHDHEYQAWAKHDKTFIILDGGTTNINPERRGTLNQHAFTLDEQGIKFAVFNEPDLGDQLAAVVFLVDDRVFDRKKWPDYETILQTYTSSGGGDHVPSYEEWLKSFSEDEEERNKILFLREFLSPRNFKLAQ